jgi:hypothetical protein
MSVRKGIIPRDFTLLPNCLTVGSSVMILIMKKITYTYDENGNVAREYHCRGPFEHHGVFLGNGFRDSDGNLFDSPYAWSKHVTRQYSDTANAPSGWSAIQVKVNERYVSISDIYDRWERSLPSA